MNLIFFNSHTFLTKEILHSLEKRTDIKTINVNIPQYPASVQTDSIIDKLKSHFPAVVLTINDAGCDYAGKIPSALTDNGCYHINWYHDYPFYEEIFHNRVIKFSDRRIDFVTEKSFLPEMRVKGMNAFFLPLATDPAYFNSIGEVEFKRDIAFVGNSSCQFINSIIDEPSGRELEKLVSLQSRLRRAYFQNPSLNINQYLLENDHLWKGKTSLNDRALLFMVEWLIGYFYRRDFISAIAKKYKNRFICFGDSYWQLFIDPSQVSTDACYYTNLCKYYRSTRINLNVNRIQIRTAFTQRIFDCAASGAFLLTDSRSCNKSFFQTEGPDREIVQFNSLEQCTELIDYYLIHEDESREIAKRAQKNVLANHTYDMRIEEMFNICRKFWGI